MAKGDINLYGKLVAGYDGPLTSAEQVAYEADGTGASFKTVHDEIEALKSGSTSSGADITKLQKEVAKKANQSDLETTNANVTAAQKAADNAATAASKAQTTADAKIAAVSGVTDNAVIVSTANHTSSVSLKIAEETGKGNVTLSQNGNGLAANITADTVADLVAVKGVATDDKVLGLTNGLVSATVAIDYYTYPKDHATKANKKVIRLLGKNSELLSEVDASEFLKDGMVSDVKFDESTKKLTITFNTDAGKDAIEVNLATLVDTYGVISGGGLKKDSSNNFGIDDTVVATRTYVQSNFDAKNAAANAKAEIDKYSINDHTLSEKTITLKGSEIEVGGTGSYSTSTVNAAVAELAAKIATVESEAGVTRIDGKTGAFTLKSGQTANGAVNIVTGTGDSKNEISATVVGLKSAAFVETSSFDKSGSAAGVKTELTNTLNAATASLKTSIESNKTNITNLDTEVKAVKETVGTNLIEAKAYADTASANAVTNLGFASASAGQFVTGVSVSNGKLAVTAAQVTAAQVSYSKAETAPATGSVANALYTIENDIATIKGSGTGSISSQIDAKINAISSSKSSTSNGVTVKVDQAKGVITGVTVTAPVVPTVDAVTAAQTTADNAASAAEKAQKTADAANTAAGVAQTTAEAAQKAADDAASKAASIYVKKAGDVMTGALTMSGTSTKAGCKIQYNATDGSIEFVFVDTVE